MPLTFEQLREEALTLPVNQRLVLADELYGSADGDDPEGPAEFTLHPDWLPELERRSEEIRSGRVKAIPAEEVFREIDTMIERL